MAASRAPHPLAEAIVDLAFPQRQSSYILLQLRHCAGGVDIAVHGGSSPGMAEEEATLMAEGELFSVPATPAGLAAFAEELATLGCWLDNFTGGDIRLGLPEEESPQHAFKDWRAVNIRLLAPQFVRVVADGDIDDIALSRLTCQDCWNSAAQYTARISNQAWEYYQQQEARRQQ